MAVIRLAACRRRQLKLGYDDSFDVARYPWASAGRHRLPISGRPSGLVDEVNPGFSGRRLFSTAQARRIRLSLRLFHCRRYAFPGPALPAIGSSSSDHWGSSAIVRTRGDGSS